MEQFFILGSIVALFAAVVFLLVSFARAFKNSNASTIHAVVFFAVSMLLLALFLLEWSFAFGSVGRETQATSGLATINAGLGQWGQILGGGIVAALLTLTGREVVSWWRRPKIAIRFEDSGVGYRREANDPPDSYWVRVKVTNSGKTTAKSCVGKIVEFKHDKKPIDRDPIRLHWIDSPWQMGSQLFDKIDVYPHQYEFLDVLLTMSTSPPQDYRTCLFTGLDSENHQDAGLTLIKYKAHTEDIPKDTKGNTTNRIRIGIYGDNVEPCIEEYSIIKGSTHKDIRLEKL